MLLRPLSMSALLLGLSCAQLTAQWRVVELPDSVFTYMSISHMVM